MLKHQLKHALKGSRRYPFVLMLEPLYTCNLACLGCAVERHTGKLAERLTPAACFKAVDDCGAPFVSICGGEPRRLSQDRIANPNRQGAAMARQIILVTDEAGFIGSAVARHLLERGEAVRVLVRRGADLRNLEGLAVELAYGDLRDRSAVGEEGGADRLHGLRGGVRDPKGGPGDGGDAGHPAPECPLGIQAVRPLLCARGHRGCGEKGMEHSLAAVC